MAQIEIKAPNMSTWVKFLALVIIIVSLVVGVAQARNAANEATRALCLQRSAYQQTLTGTQTFLNQHPNGIPSIGITRALLLRSIHNAETQIAALSDVRCP